MAHAGDDPTAMSNPGMRISRERAVQVDTSAGICAGDSLTRIIAPSPISVGLD
jgi:hypothetical protein